MPEFPSLSPPSSFPDEVQLRDESAFRKTETVPSFCATKADAGSHARVVTSSPIKKQILLESHAGNSSDTCYSYDREQRTHHHMEKHMIGVASAASHSLPRALCHDLGAISNISTQPASSFMSGDNLNFMGAQRENGLFSSSLSELFSHKLRLSSKNSTYDPSVGAAACQYEEDEPFESIEELEAQTIGNLLPDDDDDLLSGIADGIEYVTQPHGDDIEDLDFFSSVGGIDLGDDGLTFGQSKAKISGGSSTGSAGVLGSNGVPFGEHPSGEHPSRTLFVRNINSSIEDSELRSHFEKFGDIRTLYTACKSRGFVMVSYFDIRSARNAMKALHNKSLMQRKLDIHFSVPKDNPSEKDVNQGTLVVFNLDSSVSNDELHKIFGVYGEIKEIRETPFRSDQKFIEFYDVRAAEAACHALDWSDFGGKQIKVVPSLPGGARRLVQPISSELDEDGSSLSLPRNSPSMNFRAGFSGPFAHGGIPSYADNQIHGFHPASGSTHRGFAASSFDHVISSSLPNIFPSLVRMGSVDCPSGISKSGSSQGETKFDFQSNPSFHPPTRSDLHDRLSIGLSCSPHSYLSRSLTAVPSEINENQQRLRVSSNGASVETIEGVFSPSGNGSCPPAGLRSIWRNMQHPQPQNMMWPNPPSFANGFQTSHPQPIHAAPRAQNDMLTAFLPVSEHHVGSAPSVNSSLWDRRAYSGESPDALVFNPGSLGNIRISGNSPHPLEFVRHNIFPCGGESYMDTAVSSKNVGVSLPHRRNMMFPARGKLIPTMNDFGSPNERTRHRRSESASNQVDNKKQFELDVDRIARGDDKRTTLMIKNIPNKYTSKMLLAAIDEQHRGTYDFIYLPIDFKNKCNVGYAFINMIDTSVMIPFYQAFHGKKWEKFNSEKVAYLAYARIQGKASLIAHFQNSSLMNEDKRCRPILFHTDGPNAGDQVPFPVGVNVRPRYGKSRTSSSEHNREESPQNSLKEETPSD